MCKEIWNSIKLGSFSSSDLDLPVEFEGKILRQKENEAGIWIFHQAVLKEKCERDKRPSKTQQK